MSALHELATELGVEREWRGVDGQTHTVTDDTLLAVCGALTPGVERPDDTAAALRARRADTIAAGGEPVAVAWDSTRPQIVVYRPRKRTDAALRVTVEREDGVVETWRGTECTSRTLGNGPAPDTLAVEVTLPRALPFGAHTLTIEGPGLTARATVLAAPSRPAGCDRSHRWGIFAPLYALHDRERPAAGDFGSLRRFATWAGRHGADLVGTLPLLATFVGHGREPRDTSPYAPVSRRFWNEAYLDLRAIAGVDARALDDAAGPTGENADLVALANRTRTALAPHAEAAATDPALRDWLALHPDVTDYARFRAKVEGSGEEAVRYHQFVQWCSATQLTALAAELRDRGQSLFLDFPVGSHRDGFDVHHEGALFVRDASVGAPPDAFYATGQDWGFPPVDPHRARLDGHAYFRRCLDAHFRFAQDLRIDHVMGLHRLWFIPPGAGASAGAYVRYAGEEQWAALCIEAHRHRGTIVGENLGTVPEVTNRALRDHGALGMWVLQFETSPEPPAPAPTATQLACVDTHDLPPFAAWWAAIAPAQRRTVVDTLRVNGALEAQAEPGAAEALGAIYRWLGASDAAVVIAALEDLWLETEPQNRPGTPSDENFRHRGTYGFDDLDDDAARNGLVDPTRLLRLLDDARTEAARNTTRREDVTDMTTLTADDLHLFNEGRHFRLYERLGAHIDGDGVRFTVWAPNARGVSLLGTGNGWTHGSDALEPIGSSGLWTGRFPGWRAGEPYKFSIESRQGGRVAKADPFAFHAEVAPRTASMVTDLAYDWQDHGWMQQRGAGQRLDAPVSIYELHLGSWARRDDGSFFTYREIAPKLVRYVRETGFTHVELLPIMEHPFFGSWGYQTTGYFAPTSRFGSPTDFMALVDELHAAGIGVILDWVPSHFPNDEHALAQFDGTHLFEHADPRQGFHPDWNTLVFNYGRNEVRSFLTSSACFWLDRYHVDGLRVDAVASMLYLDYSRQPGEWIPNEFGGRENLEAIRFLREMNEEVYRAFPDVQTYAEESTAWPMVSRPTYIGGLGFGYKWDMGWMHDTLQHLAREPVHRRFHYNELTFRAVYAWTENYLLPLSHDEVVHGKGSLAGKMPGDRWQQLANLRTLLAYQWASPGKKLLFMGGEIGQWREWDHESSVDWDLLADDDHAGIKRLVGDLNRALRTEPALHERDADPAGFAWAVADDPDDGVLAFVRYAADGSPLLFVANFTPVVRHQYRIPVPAGGFWREVVNTDAHPYGGSDVGNLGGVDAVPVPLRQFYWSLTLQLPPLGALLLRPDPDSLPQDGGFTSDDGEAEGERG